MNDEYSQKIDSFKRLLGFRVLCGIVWLFGMKGSGFVIGFGGIFGGFNEKGLGEGVKSSRSVKCCGNRRVERMGVGGNGFSDEEVIQESKLSIANRRGEKLSALFCDRSDKKSPNDNVVVLCHGFRSRKENRVNTALVCAFEESKLSSMRFDFHGNGESEGEFQYGNYFSETEDLRCIVEYVRNVLNKNVYALIGHSKGGNAVLLYAAEYDDVPKVINISGRADLSRGFIERYGEERLEELKEMKEITIPDESRDDSYKITLESYKERLSTDMKTEMLRIRSTQLLTIHGGKDETVPVEDAYAFQQMIDSKLHSLSILPDADHRFSDPRDLNQLVLACLDFLRQ
mmetsp:Transcript_11935/g.21621  ORF Transcript_11935/g.21621 Transcript_11935/m.21621 type:complete len:344 (-) Transcript_11935:871-1902(-)